MACSWAKLRSFASNVWSKSNRRKHVEGHGLDTELRRCLTTADLVLIGLGHMMGGGIYVITGPVMRNDAGASTVLAYVMSGVAAILGGLCYAQFSVNIPKAGTSYNYVYLVFGELWGFLAGWNFILEYLILVASVGRALADYINALSGGVIQNATNAAIGDLDTPVFGPVNLLATTLIIVFFVVVAIGVRSSVNVNNLMTVLNISVLLTIVITSMCVGNVDNFSADEGGFFPFGFSGTMRAAAITFFAYVGFDAIAVASEETKDPSKSLPLAICIAIGVVSFLYCSAAFALSLLVPYYEVSVDTPYPSAFKSIGLEWAVYVVTVGAIFGMVASLLGQAFCLPRGIYAIATDGLLFKPLMYINRRTQTPLVAIAISTVLSALLATFVKVAILVEMVSIGTLFAMTLMTASLLKLHYLPGRLCPFELNIHGTRFFPTEIQDVTESMPVTEKRGNGQSLETIGQLKYDIPYLNKTDPNTVTTIVVGVLMCTTVGLTAVFVHGWEMISQGNWFFISLFVLFVIGYIGCVGVLFLYEHNVSFAKFHVPLVPWLLEVTLLINLILMMVLQPISWIRLGVWIVVGFIIYFAYGIRHSTADKDNYIEMKEEKTDTIQDVQSSSELSSGNQ